jgi:hypothetical protein
MPAKFVKRALEHYVPALENGTLNSKRWQKFWSSSGLSLDIVSDKQVSTGTLGRKNSRSPRELR